MTKQSNHLDNFNASLLLLTTFLFFFAGLFAVQADSVSGSQTVKLIVSGKPALFEVPLYLTDSGVVMAPVDFVRLLGGEYAEQAGNTVLLTTPSGRTFTESFDRVHDRLMVPLLSTAQQMGAATTWSPSTDTVTLKAKLIVAQVQNDNVIIVTSYPVYYKTQSLDNPARLVVDVYGADLDSPPATVPSDSQMVTRIRTGQLDPDTVRLVLDLSHPVHFQVSSSLQTKEIQLALGTKDTDTAPVSSVAAKPFVKPAPLQTQIVTAARPLAASVPTGMVPLPSLYGPPAGSTKIVDVEYKSDSPNVYQIVVTTAGPVDSSAQSYHSFFLDNPNRLAFDVPNSVISLADAAVNTLSSIIPGDNPLLKSIRWGMVNAGQLSNGRIVVDLEKPITYTVTTTTLSDNSGLQYTITVGDRFANSGDHSTGSIAGKVVIVDAGHGGKDSGAPGRGGIEEKNFTLAIAKQVRDALIAAGATPIMTRSDDTFIPLNDRSQMGIDNHADYFISIHCDSSGEQNSRSGDTVYYHGDNTVCRAFARSIANRLAQLDIAIQSDGVKSDFVRYPGVGFSVLRKSPEPAVLVECGYVDDDSDAKCLADTDSLQSIATGIVAGLRDYVANQ